MDNLNQIERRHGRDGWRDVLFIGFAVLLTALSIGAMTSQGAGKPIVREWSVTVVESGIEVVE